MAWSRWRGFKRTWTILEHGLATKPRLTSKVLPFMRPVATSSHAWLPQSTAASSTLILSPPDDFGRSRHLVNHLAYPYVQLAQPQFCRNFHTSNALADSKTDSKTGDGDDKPLTKGQMFKKMFKDYWYVLVPVHVATSIVWYGGFYMMCKSGVDVASILETLGASEAYVEKLKNSNMGYYALAYACYKVATPARYTVTIGGTTLSIKYLSAWGYLKTTEQVAADMREKQQEVKDKMTDARQRFDESTQERVQAAKDQYQERKKKFDDRMSDRKKKFDDWKNK